MSMGVSGCPDTPLNCFFLKQKQSFSKNCNYSIYYIYNGIFVERGLFFEKKEKNMPVEFLDINSCTRP